MAKRSTQSLVMLEYIPAIKIRSTQSLVMLEYIPAIKIRSTQVLVQYEYYPRPSTARTNGPSAQNM